jgi:hypothetical protein
MAAVLPYVLGALGGSGVLCVLYGLKILRDAEAPDSRRQKGFALVSLGLLAVAASLYLIRLTG